MKLGKPMKACYFDSFAAPPRISFKSSHIPKSPPTFADLPNPKPVIQPVVSLTLSYLLFKLPNMYIWAPHVDALNIVTKNTSPTTKYTFAVK